MQFAFTTTFSKPGSLFFFLFFILIINQLHNLIEWINKKNAAWGTQHSSFDISTEYVNNEMIIFAVLGPLGAQTSFNHVWQAGSSVSNNIPQVHPLYCQSVLLSRPLDFLSL